MIKLREQAGWVQGRQPQTITTLCCWCLGPTLIPGGSSTGDSVELMSSRISFCGSVSQNEQSVHRGSITAKLRGHFSQCSWTSGNQINFVLKWLRHTSEAEELNEEITGNSYTAGKESFRIHIKLCHEDSTQECEAEEEMLSLLNTSHILLFGLQ
jgi:hypothetical protein